MGMLGKEGTGRSGVGGDDGNDGLVWVSENGNGAGAGLCVVVDLCPNLEMYFGCDAFCDVDGDGTSRLRIQWYCLRGGFSVASPASCCLDMCEIDLQVPRDAPGVHSLLPCLSSVFLRHDPPSPYVAHRPSLCRGIA